MPLAAEQVHGLSDAFLADKKRFHEHALELIEFLGDAPLVAHNAQFDFGFLNYELGVCGHPEVVLERMIDTLVLARRRHPGAKHSLDALCMRYGIDRSHRVRHGALLDAELLAQVYVELTGGRQIGLALAAESRRSGDRSRRVPAAPARIPPASPAFGQRGRACAAQSLSGNVGLDTLGAVSLHRTAPGRVKNQKEHPRPWISACPATRSKPVRPCRIMPRTASTGSARSISPARFPRPVTFGKAPANAFACDIVLHANQGLILKSHGQAQDAHQAFDQASDKIEKQLRRYKRRLKDRHEQTQSRRGARKKPPTRSSLPTSPKPRK